MRILEELKLVFVSLPTSWHSASRYALQVLLLLLCENLKIFFPYNFQLICDFGLLLLVYKFAERNHLQLLITKLNCTLLGTELCTFEGVAEKGQQKLIIQ